MPSRVCISIAVSSPERLEPLPGAITASRDVLGWAKAAGFVTPPGITDEDGSAVTVARLNAALMPVVGAAAEKIDHLILHYAGHGVAADAEDQFLLLTNWRKRPDEAIRLSRFMRLLQFYQPGRVSLFIDACRSRPSKETDELNGSGILNRPEEEPVEFLEDRFRAVVHATESYMILDPQSGEARCLFTTVLLKALCGVYPEAIEPRDSDRVVTSGRIYRAVTAQLPKEATRYRLSQTPSLKPAFVAPDDVYTRLPIDFVAPDLPPPAPAPAAAERGIRLERREVHGIWPADDVEAEAPSSPVDLLAQKIRDAYRAEQIPTHFETGAGLAVNGGQLRTPPVISPPATIEPDQQSGDSSWWRIMFADRHSGPQASLAIELVDGSWVGSAALRGKILSISIDKRSHVGVQPPQLAPPRGAVSMIYRPESGTANEIAVDRQLVSDTAEDILARLRAGALTGDEALSVASRIRYLKHVDPMLGTVAAYLYDAVGDRDSIRRIAWFYASAGETIPFDVALLADLRGQRDAGRLHVTVPAVARRVPRTAEEQEHKDYFCETSEVKDARVAGGFPWLRQGWALLDAVRLPVCPDVLPLAKAILPLPFTTLAPEAGRALAHLIQQGEV